MDPLPLDPHYQPTPEELLEAVKQITQAQESMTCAFRELQDPTPAWQKLATMTRRPHDPASVWVQAVESRRTFSRAFLRKREDIGTTGEWSRMWALTTETIGVFWCIGRLYTSASMYRWLRMYGLDHARDLRVIQAFVSA